SAFVNIHDRSTNILFGDGAGVIWLEPSAEEGIIDAFMQSNGDGRDFLNIEGGGSLYPTSEKPFNQERSYLKQDGKVVFKQAVQWLIPHQANERIIDAVGKDINTQTNKTLTNIEYRGNTIAATIPLCIWENIKQIQKGDLLMLTAFGAGFSWGASLLRWMI